MTRHVRYIGDPDETNKFQFKVLFDGIVYNVVFKDGYPQAIENVKDYKKPFDEWGKIPDSIIEEICEQVETWFEKNENKAWWLLEEKNT